jgi:hypothetical protein
MLPLPYPGVMWHPSSHYFEFQLEAAAACHGGARLTSATGLSMHKHAEDAQK